MGDAAALDRLIAAVEAGEISTDLIRAALADDPPRCMWCLAAFDGSTDAAILLVADLLPGWRWEVWKQGNHRQPVEAFGALLVGSTCRYCTAATPARALLLATLKAMKEGAAKPRVKPLVWRGDTDFWRAPDGLGGYYEVMDTNAGVYLTHMVDGTGRIIPASSKRNPFHEPEQAQAAAQADHDARVLSLLVLP